MAGDPYREDFRNFMWEVWQCLNLPDPTPAQYRIAEFLQHGWDGHQEGVGRTDIIEAFRGIGKSYISAAYCLWRLYRDPVNEKILVVSATASKAKAFVRFAKQLLDTMPLLGHLRPQDDQLAQADQFDVRGASNAQVPSLMARGITSQITGARATLIVADDVEIPDNSKTEEARERLLSKVAEFEFVKVPGADVLFLGTPQSYESIYVKLVKERGYRCYMIPARYPGRDKWSPETESDGDEAYRLKRPETGEVVELLAPFIRVAIGERPELAGRPTDPKRFDHDELLRREASAGRSKYLLQYMLDTSLSDAEKYPLKLRNLIVMPVNTFKAPAVVQWGRNTSTSNVLPIPNWGFTGDHFLGPLFVADEWRDFENAVMFVDPSGEGADETAWAVVKVLNGMLFVPEVGGHGGTTMERMTAVAQAAMRHRIGLVLVEPNYAGEVWVSAFQPILKKVWPAAGCSVQLAEWARIQKEVRIIDTLEPVLGTHRLVVDESVARDEALGFQLTHITRDRGSLRHDDRLDALAGAVGHFTRTLGLDVAEQVKEMHERELEALLEDFVETAKWGTMRRGRGRQRADGYRPEVVSVSLH